MNIRMPLVLSLLALTISGILFWPLVADGPNCCPVETPTKSEPTLEVHEWGTFTSVSGSDAVALDWRPLNGPSDLPSFVYGSQGTPAGLRHGIDFGRGVPDCDPETGVTCKACHFGKVRMETPVIYFYTNNKIEVTVRVRFPEGRITEWYPQARETGAGIDWGRILLLPGETVSFPHDGTKSHYYPAREVDAVPLRVCGDHGMQYENLLFYRGVGTFSPPLCVAYSEVKYAEAKLLLSKQTQEAIPAWIIFENRRGQIRWQQSRSALNDPCNILWSDQIAANGDNLKAAKGALKTLLVAQGLFEKEANAMIATWEDSWFEEGLRVLYIVPREETDRRLPLRVLPEPQKTVRVLVGRAEVLSVVDEMAAKKLLDSYTPDDQTSVADLQAGLARWGRFSEPLLGLLRGKARADNNPELVEKIDAFLALENLRLMSADGQ